MNRPRQIRHNLTALQTAIRQACQRGGRDEQTVHCMAVTKYAADEDVLTLLNTGEIRHIGESRVQQALARWTQPSFAKQRVIKHFIGHLQRNKIAQAVALFDFIDSIDSIQTAQLVDLHARKLSKIIPVLLQIKLTNRESQSGVALRDAPTLLKDLRQLPNIQPCGYMAIAPQVQDASQLRPLFKQVKMAFDQDFPADTERYLSLGMSNDFETAVEEGSTLPRIGSKLFAQHLEEL